MSLLAQFSDLLVLAAVSVLAGYLAGGRLTGLLRRRLVLLYAAVAVQLVEFYLPPVHAVVLHGFGRLFTAAVFGLVLAWLLLNARSATRGVRTSLALVATGLVLNGAVLFVSGRIPFWPPAARAAGLPEALINEDGHVKNVAASASSRLVFLGDVVPVPVLAKVFSIGDLAIAAGVVALVVMGMRVARSAEVAHAVERQAR